MNNQYILIVKYKELPEAVYLNTDREFLESVVETSCTKFEYFEYARLYKAHYPLTSLVKSWEKEN